MARHRSQWPFRMTRPSGDWGPRRNRRLYLPGQLPFVPQNPPPGGHHCDRPRRGAHDRRETPRKRDDRCGCRHQGLGGRHGPPLPPQHRPSVPGLRPFPLHQQRRRRAPGAGGRAGHASHGRKRREGRPRCRGHHLRRGRSRRRPPRVPAGPTHPGTAAGHDPPGRRAGRRQELPSWRWTQFS